MHKQKTSSNILAYSIMILLVIIFIAPILIVFMNSFKGNLYISNAPFAFPNSETFVGFQNYILGLTKIGFFSSFLTSAFITVFSTGFIVLLTAMTAWYLIRVKNKLTTGLYYMFVFSMVVPFQMVMFTMSWVASQLSMGSPWGIVPLYVGFGSGLSVFMYAGFIKSVPLDIEEAATIDGCNPLQTFFQVVFPIMKPTAITIAILNAMWIWNDYLLPKLVLSSEYKTIPIAVQGVLTGSYGGKDMGALMAMLILSIIPIIAFYLSAQKYIIKGVIAGAVKG